MKNKKTVIILGPTASGKTSLSVNLALETGGEVIGADSVQIYRDLVIGAATPTEEERHGVPHHLVGELDLDTEMDARKFVDMVHDRVGQVESRGRIPIMVGGTNFYVYSFLDGLSPVPDLDEQERRKVFEKMDHISVSELYEKLQEIDPEWIKTISSPNDIQRIKRGLEVFYITGKPLSEWNRLPRIGRYDGSVLKIAPLWDRAVLYDRVNRRSRQMISGGLIQEVEKLMKLGFSPEKNRALRSIGYQETFSYLRGEINSIEELEYKISLNTRHLAKRQLTWLRRDTDIHWIEPENWDGILNLVNKFINS